MSRKERHFQGIAREIRNFPKIIISDEFFVSNNFVSEGRVTGKLPPKRWIQRCHDMPLKNCKKKTSFGCLAISHWHFLQDTSTAISKETLYTPLSHPIFWPRGHFSGRGGGYIFCSRPRAGALYPPPSFTRSPPVEGYFQGWGVGCIKFGPINFIAQIRNLEPPQF